MYKLGHLQDGKWNEHVHAAEYHLPISAKDIQRVVAGVPRGNPEVFTKLVLALQHPYHLLYVLHTPRGEGQAGRYQSSPIDETELQGFLSEFGRFLAQDARFDLWAHSPSENATVVWDRHNRIFAYGPISRFEQTLLALGFTHGEPGVPAPHAHHYRAEFDLDAGRLLGAFEWSYSPLQAEDEQRD